MLNNPPAKPPAPILFYEGPHYYLSNFSAFAIYYGEPLRAFWMTVEHAYQAAKFKPVRDADIRAEIMHATSAHEAKQIGKKHIAEVRRDWERIKLGIMEGMLQAKFNQHPYIQRKLLETDNTPLIEDSPKDSFWGRGPDGKGANNLGKLWEKIRAEELAKPGGIITD